MLFRWINIMEFLSSRRRGHERFHIQTHVKLWLNKIKMQHNNLLWEGSYLEITGVRVHWQNVPIDCWFCWYKFRLMTELSAVFLFWSENIYTCSCSICFRWRILQSFHTNGSCHSCFHTEWKWSAVCNSVQTNERATFFLWEDDADHCTTAQKMIRYHMKGGGLQNGLQIFLEYLMPIQMITE